MKHDSRIPLYDEHSLAGMREWFKAMNARGLSFHPEDDPGTIVSVRTDTLLFSVSESAELDVILQAMFSEHGDAVCDVAFDVLYGMTGAPPGSPRSPANSPTLG